MKTLQLASGGSPLSVLLLGAHSDDIEIGAGATMLSLLGGGASIEVTWCVLSSGGSERQVEAEASAADFLVGASRKDVEVQAFQDGFFPQQGRQIKEWFEQLKSRCNPDVIFTHYRKDAHQDHRQVCELTWNTFRDHFILEYEIPKWDGDLGQPSLYFPVEAQAIERKMSLLQHHFRT